MPLDVCLAGAGRIAAVYASALEKLPELAGVRLRAVADSNLDAAARLGRRLACATYASSIEMIEALSPDALVICTPPSTHAAIACHALNRGVSVLCEKPLSIGLDGALSIVEAAVASGTPFMMSSRFSFADDVLSAVRHIESGVLGPVARIDQVFALAQDISKDWRSDPAVSGGGILMDKGPQSIDLVRLFIGAPTAIRVALRHAAEASTVEDCVVVDVRGGNGTTGSSLLSWRGEDDSDVFTRITAAGGEIRLGWTESLLRRENGDWERLGNGYRQGQAFLAQLTDFLEAVRGGRAMRVSPADALASAAAIEAGYASLRTGDWVTVSGQNASGGRPFGQDGLQSLGGPCHLAVCDGRA